MTSATGEARSDKPSCSRQPPVRPAAPLLSLRGTVAAAGYLVLTASLLGLFGAYSWLFDLFSHFRPHYALLLLIAGLALLHGTRKTTAVIFLAGAVLNFIPLLPLFLQTETPEKVGTAMTVMLVNVNTQRGSPQKVRLAVQEANPDILVLQEINDTWAREMKQLQILYPHQVLAPRADNFGIGVFSKFPINGGEAKIIGTADVPTITGRVDTPSGPLDLVATHPLPPVSHRNWQHRNNQLEDLAGLVKNKVPTLVVGDLNTTPWNHHFQKLLRQTGLQYSGRGFGLQPTWPTGYFRPKIPIDHCLHSPEIAILNHVTGPHVDSDHYPLIVDFFIKDNAP